MIPSIYLPSYDIVRCRKVIEQLFSQFSCLVVQLLIISQRVTTHAWFEQFVSSHSLAYCFKIRVITFDFFQDRSTTFFFVAQNEYTF